MAARFLVTTGVSAPRRSLLTSRSARPVATAYRRTRPQNDLADQLASVMNLINRALEHGHLSFDDLAPAAETVQTEAARLLLELATFLKAHGGEGRYEEAYEDRRVALGVYLDLLGILPVASGELLERAQSFEDLQVALFAIVSLLKRQIEPAQMAIKRCASSHAVRDDLYAQLKRLDRRDLFPKQHLNLESFAARGSVMSAK